MKQEDTRRWVPLKAGGLVTPDQQDIVRTAFILLRTTQIGWARERGIDPIALSRTLNGHFVIRQSYADEINALVESAHPVQLAA